MKTLMKVVAAAALGTVISSGSFAENAMNAPQIEHHVAKVDGILLHYVTAGTGEPVLLIPGWPESWIAWRKVMPLLVHAGRRVVVLDPRGGIGESESSVVMTSTPRRATCTAFSKRMSTGPAKSRSGRCGMAGRWSLGKGPRLRFHRVWA
jgi:hypothetical protein